MSSEHVQATIEASAAATSVASKTAFFAGSSAAAGKLLGLDPITFIGLVVGVGGLVVSVASFIVNWYYKREENKRKKELHTLEMKQLSGDCNVK
jgi:hypothetical protein